MNLSLFSRLPATSLTRQPRCIQYSSHSLTLGGSIPASPPSYSDFCFDQDLASALTRTKVLIGLSQPRVVSLYYATRAYSETLLVRKAHPSALVASCNSLKLIVFTGSVEPTKPNTVCLTRSWTRFVDLPRRSDSL